MGLSPTRPRYGPSLLYARGDRTIINPEDGQLVVVGETPQTRTIYAVVSTLCLFVLAVLLGHRARSLKKHLRKKANLTTILICVLFFFGINFIITVSVVELGLGLATHKICYGAAIICLVFYTGSKLSIYIFLLERARVVRAPFMHRTQDYLWLGGITIIVGGFGIIAIVGYLTPIVELSKLDGRCRIGLPAKVSFPLLSFDVGVNVLLTGLFVWLLKPVVNPSGNSTWAALFGKLVKKIKQKVTRRPRDTDSSQVEEAQSPHLSIIKRSIKVLLWKSLVGSMLIMFPTVGNMAQFYIMKGRELGWICLTICTLDISWGVLVINWLTIGSVEAEESLTRSLKSMRSMNETPTLERRTSMTGAQRPQVDLTISEVSQEMTESRRSADRGGPKTAGEAVRQIDNTIDIT